MDFTYSIWILLLPLISFLVIGLPEFVNKKYSWSHKTAGLIGTCSLGLVAALSYYTAFQYFTADRLADGTFGKYRVLREEGRKGHSLLSGQKQSVGAGGEARRRAAGL